MFGRITVAAAVFAIAGAAFAATPLKGFVIDSKHAYNGEYVLDEKTPVRVGKWALDHFEINGEAEVPSDKKVLIVFNDVTSPKKNGEMGEYYSIRAQIFPSAVRLDPKGLAFAGTDKSVGAFTFEGTFDKDYFKSSGSGINSAHPTDRNILHGTLTIAGKAHKAELGWFEGD